LKSYKYSNKDIVIRKLGTKQRFKMVGGKAGIFVIIIEIIAAAAVLAIFYYYVIPEFDIIKTAWPWP
jgi:hypothetical protein